MLKSIAYYLRLISVVLFVIFVCLLLGVVFNCGAFGISFLVMCSLFVLINIFTVLSRKDIYKELVSYNLISFAHSLMYTLNYDYFKTNFIIIDLVILGIILNTLFMYFWDIKKDQ